MSRTRLGWLAWVSGVLGCLLLVWPVSPDVALWDLPGAFGGGTVSMDGVITPLSSLFAGEPLADGIDRLQLAVGLLLIGAGIGVGIGIGLAHRTRRSAPVDTEPRIHAGYQA